MGVPEGGDSGSGTEGGIADGGGTEGGIADGGEGGTPNTIQDVQSDTMAAGTAVALAGVVVTAIDSYGAVTGNVWVEEPQGGQRSGVLVAGAPSAQVAALHVGDVVSITGAMKAEVASPGDTSGNTDTELVASTSGSLSVTKTGTGSVPAPAMVNALAIGQLSTAAARSAAWKAWDGVLVELTSTSGGVSVLDNPSQVTSGGNSDPTLVSFDTNGTIRVESALAALPGCATAGAGCSLTSPAIGASGQRTCLASVTGVVDYSFGYAVLPVTTAGVATGGTGCPPAENGNSLCTDGIDNDGNGLTDCADLGCEVGPGAYVPWTTCSGSASMCGCLYNTTMGQGASTAAAIGTTPKPLILYDVWVVAIGSSDFWVADSGTASAGHGVHVFLPAGASASGLSVGTDYTYVRGLAELQSAPAGGQTVAEVLYANVGPPAPYFGTLTPLSASVTNVTSLTGGAPYAGVLVTVTGPFKVTSAPTPQGDPNGEVTLVDNSGNTLTMGDEAYANYGGTLPATGTCYASITGVMDLDTAAQVRTINPTSAASLPTSTACL